jgi:hypothetical protein
MTRLEKGQQSDIFRKNNASKSHPEHLSFSLYYKIGANEKSLDVVCKDQMECDIWVRGLLYLIKNSDKIMAEAGDLTQDLDHFDGHNNVKIVNVKSLHQQMHAHLDLCTWGSSQWGQLGHSDRASEIKDEVNPKASVGVYNIHVHVPGMNAGVELLHAICVLPSTRRLFVYIQQQNSCNVIGNVVVSCRYD